MSRDSGAPGWMADNDPSPTTEASLHAARHIPGQFLKVLRHGGYHDAYLPLPPNRSRKSAVPSSGLWIGYSTGGRMSRRVRFLLPAYSHGEAPRYSMPSQRSQGNSAGLLIRLRSVLVGVARSLSLDLPRGAP